MDIQQEERPTKGIFYIEKEGNRVAEMTYSRAGDTRIIIDHTEVGEALRGKGAGKKLVEAAVAYAREKGIRITALCPFAHSVFQKNPELRDVL